MIYKNNLTKDNDYEYIFRRNSQDLQRQYLKVIWSTKEDSQ